jgi:hypothetical protein
MLMDTGADVTRLPASSVEKLGPEPTHNVAYEIQGFDGEPKLATRSSWERCFQTGENRNEN